MAQGSRWKTWIGGTAAGLFAWALWLGSTGLAVVVGHGSMPPWGSWMDSVAWPVWLGVPSGAYLLWRVIRGASPGYVLLGLATGLAFPLLLFLGFALLAGVPHA